MRQLNVRILFADLTDDFAPQNRGLQNVGFIDGGHFVTTFTGRFKSDARDTFDFKAVIHLGIKSFLMLTAAFAAFRLAEVDAAGQFANAENVEAVGGDVGAQRAELFQPLIQFGRAQVAEQFEVFTQRQQGAALWLFCGRQVFPLRAANGAEQDRVRLLASGDRRLRQGSSLAVDGRAADVVLAGGNVHGKTLAHGFQYFHRLVHHFRANAITRQNGNMVILRHYTVSLLFSLF